MKTTLKLVWGLGVGLLCLSACGGTGADAADDDAAQAVSVTDTPSEFRGFGMDRGELYYEQFLTFVARGGYRYAVAFSRRDFRADPDVDTRGSGEVEFSREGVALLPYGPGNCQLRIIVHPEWDGFWVDSVGTNCREDARKWAQTPTGIFLRKQRTTLRHYRSDPDADGVAGDLFVYDIARNCKRARDGKVNCPYDLKDPTKFIRGTTMYLTSPEGRAEHSKRHVPTSGIIPQNLLGDTIDHSSNECRITLSVNDGNATTEQEGTCSPGSGPQSISFTRTWRLLGQSRELSPTPTLPRPAPIAAPPALIPSAPVAPPIAPDPVVPQPPAAAPVVVAPGGTAPAPAPAPVAARGCFGNEGCPAGQHCSTQDGACNPAGLLAVCAGTCVPGVPR